MWQGEGSDKSMATKDPFPFSVEPLPEKGISLWENLAQDHCHYLRIRVALILFPSWN